jgi:hypothetical protein
MADSERRKKLVTDLRGYESYDRRLNTMMHQAANDIERLQRELDSTLNLLYQESERRAKAEHELDLWKKQG